MKKLFVKLENSYGIKQLDCDFDFEKSKTYSIYAPNGSMKTSFTKTFNDIANKSESKDLMYPDRITKRDIKADTIDLEPEKVFIVEPYNSAYYSEKTSTLLANKALRKQYEDIWNGIKKLEDTLLKALKKPSGLSKDIDLTVSKAFTGNPDDFLKTIQRVKDEVNDGKEPAYDTVSYKIVFDPKVLQILNDIQPQLKDYIARYDELVDQSKYFKKGSFNHTNALVIAKALVKQGFFDASHAVSLSDGKIVKSEDELKKIIEDELNEILKDKKLKETFDKIDGKFSTDGLKDFREYITLHQEIIPELANITSFEQKVWVDYFKICLKEFNELVDEYAKARTELDSLQEEAKKEQPRWKEIIKQFNDRFSVPFKLSVSNQNDVILNGLLPVLTYTFEDESGIGKDVEKSNLINALSNGERKALYILEILFEVEARVDLNQETLMIVDDIADSFDYKNKYAIIEYLKDISEKDNFYQIILTHNFDFFRTIESRFSIYKYCLTAERTVDGISLIPIEEQHIKNPFDYFLSNTKDDAKLLALIPFVRNIVEYKEPKDEYKKLTSVLHQKADTDTITVKDVQDIIKNNFNRTIDVNDASKKVAELFIETADTLSSKTDALGLENKIVLSVAIRLKAEAFMITAINDAPKTDAIKINQTIELTKIYVKDTTPSADDVGIIKRVNLITPQNIHINSFMYEPILDMSDKELKDLYQDIGKLK